MKTRTVTTRVAGMMIAVAATACAPQAARGQAATASPAVEVAPARPAEVSDAGPATRPMRRDLEKQHQDHQSEQGRHASAMARMQADMARAQGDMARAQGDLARANKDILFKDFAFVRSPSPDTPMVIFTQPMDAAAQMEMREDLTVMDKLIREEAADAGADAPEAMSIKLTLLGRQAPMYVEGAGAVFHGLVNWPLAPVGAGSGNKDDRPRDPQSKWDQAKRSLSGYGTKRMGPPGGKESEPPLFDQAKLDALRNTLLGVLPEATNIRHLKENESVFITIQGIDDGGAPVRMTLKATKADIDAAAAGKITRDEFAQRVAQRIG